MDAFETVVCTILRSQGFWAETSLKVNLSKEEKRAIGRPSSPRWELDVVAYRARDNLLRVVECKSYLDSQGVGPGAFNGSDTKAQSRYKLFCDDNLREIVFGRLREQLVSGGYCREDPTIQLCLAAGKVAKEQDRIEAHFEARGWLFLSPAYLKAELLKLSEGGYEDDVVSVVAKLLMREPKKL